MGNTGLLTATSVFSFHTSETVGARSLYTKDVNSPGVKF